MVVDSHLDIFSRISFVFLLLWIFPFWRYCADNNWQGAPRHKPVPGWNCSAVISQLNAVLCSVHSPLENKYIHIHLEPTLIALSPKRKENETIKNICLMKYQAVYYCENDVDTIVLNESTAPPHVVEGNFPKHEEKVEDQGHRKKPHQRRVTRRCFAAQQVQQSPDSFQWEPAQKTHLLHRVKSDQR